MTELPYIRQQIEFAEPVRYAHGPDSARRPGVPQGSVSQYGWNTSAVYPGTSRRFWVYAPAQYAAISPAAVMVFQDGAIYLDPKGEIRAGIVLDNLIHQGEMPVTIAIFVDPGEPDHRNAEYDAFSATYAEFVLSEIVPQVRRDYQITDNPDRWAICGGSSGGNCAFTAAWTRPDQFRRVVSFLGSFAQLEGGNCYPELIRSVPAKPLRVFMQAATRDIGFDEPEFNWLSENLQVAAALAERGYDMRFVLGDGGHNVNHCGAILPDALRWLWRP